MLAGDDLCNIRGGARWGPR